MSRKEIDNKRRFNKSNRIIRKNRNYILVRWRMGSRCFSRQTNKNS